MRTTLDIDEDVLQKVRERADATGRSPGKILSEMARRGLDVDIQDLPRLRNGLPQIRFDSSFEPAPDSILDLFEKIERTDDLGAPLIIPRETRQWIEQTTREQNIDAGKLAVRIAQESLLQQGKWPTRNGVPQLLRRPDDPTVITVDFIDQLQEELG